MLGVELRYPNNLLTLTITPKLTVTPTFTLTIGVDHYINQSINQSMLFIPEYSIHIQIMLSHSYAIKKQKKLNKLVCMYIIAYASNAGAMGKCIYDHCQQCSVGLYCMTSL